MKRMKCYIYTRVSTSMQVDGYSLDAQKDKLCKYAEFQNMLVAGEYCDEGKSGKNIEGRPEFLRMIRLCKQKKIDIRQGWCCLCAGVQALPLRLQRRGRADLPATDAGHRRQPHLRGGRH